MERSKEEAQAESLLFHGDLPESEQALICDDCYKVISKWIDEKERIFQVKLSYATFGIVVQKSKVIKAPSIGKWMIGKELQDVVIWTKKKGGQIKELFGEKN